MSKPAVTVKKSGIGTAEFARRVRELKRQEVYVGIQAKDTARKKGKINNASLLFVHENSERPWLPQRKILVPGIEANKQIIAPMLMTAAKAVLANKPDEATRDLNLAGTAGANSVKRFVEDKVNLKPNAPSTIRRKKSDTPLVDTGDLIRSVTYVVKRKA